ncbi:uncharacterized protein LOC134831920 [Culicoides brevitarsis]|uniref:uncharacterized protein LOC134831920 n=1 Tax=Culicoides brevitarsis TaxID=469753 RepID=UPI00307B4320
MNRISKDESLSMSMEHFKQKQVKITKHQKAVLVDFLEQNFEYSKGAFKLLPTTTHDDKNVLWEAIAERLNGIGPVKTPNMWRKTCADLRMQIKKKVMEEKELTDDDKRMVKFYGLRLDPLVSSRLVNDRVTAGQKSRMVDLMRDNYWWNSATQRLEPASNESLEWDEIAERLNEIGGCVKNTMAWRKCWSDIKCDVGKKFQNGAVPSTLTEDEYKIATLYGWLNAENLPPNETFEQMDTDAAVQYVIEPSSVVIKPEKTSIDDEEIIITDDPPEGFEIEQLEEENNEPQEVSEEQTPEERTVYVTQAETQTDDVPNPTSNNDTVANTILLEQILAAQQRTNALLEQLLQRNSAGNDIQNGILDELKNNSFMMVNRASQK